MNIAEEIKNAVRKAIFELSPGINFNFNEILTVTYPYVFFSIKNLELERPIDTCFQNVKALCLIEYAPSPEPKNEDLFKYQQTLSEALSTFDFWNTKIQALNAQFSISEKTLVMSFELSFYARLEDETEVMEEIVLDIT